MKILFPSSPFDNKIPEENYADEYRLFKERGFSCILFSFEDFETGKFKITPSDIEDETILYRGWMMDVEMYSRLNEEIQAKGGRLLTNPSQYKKCHHLPEWYEDCKEFTPETKFFSKEDNFKLTLQNLNWSGYFVKDYVKSLTTNQGSITKNIDEIQNIISKIEAYRGKIEGGVCVRKMEEFIPETEERYFVFQGVPYSRSGIVPEIVSIIANRIDSPFFSVDLIKDKQDNTWLIELGDGQVSDLKKWTPEKFVEEIIKNQKKELKSKNIGFKK